MSGKSLRFILTNRGSSAYYSSVIMIRNKRLIQKLALTLMLTVSLLTILGSGIAWAAPIEPVTSGSGGGTIGPAPGCYSSNFAINKVACSPASDTKDSQKNPVDTSTNCYLVDGSGSQATYTEINCSNIVTSGNYCGGPGQAVATSIDFGCKHQGNPIVDILFAIIRFLSLGVGIVVIASIVVAGIQFTVSKGDPQATGNAIGRIRSSVIALIIYIFAYALLNYIIPNGFFSR